MTIGNLRPTALAIVMLVALDTNTSAQNVTQGDLTAAAAKTAFQSPMIVNTVLAAADRSLWQTGKWFSVKEYEDLGRFTCDGLSLRRDYKPKHETWTAGLLTSAEPVSTEKVRVRFKATINNPDDNHDKVVKLLLEVMHGQTVVKSVAMSGIGVEEGQSGSGQASVILSTSDLETDPPPTLRITMTTEND